MPKSTEESYTRICPKCSRSITYLSSKSLKRATDNESNCRNCALSLRIVSDEHKKKISEANKGISRRGIGWHHSEETKYKIGKSNSECSLETRQLLSKINTGKKHSRETRRKISLAQIGRKTSPETIEKMRKAQHIYWKKQLGVGPVKNSRALKYWSSEVKHRDNYSCVYCGTQEMLNSHHILCKYKHPELALCLNNGITLCISCHKNEHKLNGYI